MSLNVEIIRAIPKLTAKQYIEKLFSDSADEYTMIAHAGALERSVYVSTVKIEGVVGLSEQDRK